MSGVRGRVRRLTAHARAKTSLARHLQATTRARRLHVASIRMKSCSPPSTGATGTRPARRSASAFRSPLRSPGLTTTRPAFWDDLRGGPGRVRSPATVVQPPDTRSLRGRREGELFRRSAPGRRHRPWRKIRDATIASQARRSRGERAHGRRSRGRRRAEVVEHFQAYGALQGSDEQQ